MEMTYFHPDGPIPSAKCTHGVTQAMDWDSFCEKLARKPPIAPAKGFLPLIKLGTYTGNSRAEGSTLQTIHGIEGDYDGEKVEMADAAMLLADAGLKGMLYPSPSDAPGRPRWRVMCPTSRELPAAERKLLVGRLNAVLGGILSSESFTDKQTFYIGHLPGKEFHVQRVNGHRHIDEATEIEPLPARVNAHNGMITGPISEIPDAELRRCITDGVKGQIYPSMVSLCARLAGRGMAMADITGTVRGLLESATWKQADPETWHDRHKSVPDMAASAVSKYRDRRDNGAPPTDAETRFKNALEETCDIASIAKDFGLKLTKKGICQDLANIARILEQHPEFKGRIWYDDFLQEIRTTWRSTDPRLWQDADDLELTLWLQQTLGMRRLGRQTASDAVILVSSRNRKHCIVDWLQSLRWDGVPRISSMLPDVFGAAQMPYVAAASRNFLVGMVARVLRPGCQLDHMPVLEGGQGIGKSSGLRALGGVHYGTAHDSVMAKDFFVSLQGKWLIEIAEMDAFTRAETSRVKDVISTPCDRFRPPYGRHALDWPRQSVFAGTTNADDWARDDTGGRRFWPIRCGSEVRLDLISQLRDQYFAEALHEFTLSPKWWEMPAGATEEQQLLRHAEDPWADAIARYLESQTVVTIPGILENALNLPVERRGKVEQMRVASILRLLGWYRELKRVKGGLIRRWTKTGHETGGW